MHPFPAGFGRNRRVYRRFKNIPILHKDLFRELHGSDKQLDGTDVEGTRTAERDVGLHKSTGY